jgi:DNA-binding NarL/FixJ family response regulator
MTIPSTETGLPLRFHTLRDGRFSELSTRSSVTSKCRNLLRWCSSTTTYPAFTDRPQWPASPLAAGARGYVAKHAEVAEILNAIETICASPSGTFVSPQLAAYLLDANRQQGPDSLRLSPREQEVLLLVAQGERDQDIAETLFISVGTVRSHLDHIRTKTGERRRPGLTRFAVDQGLVPDPGDS